MNNNHDNNNNRAARQLAEKAPGVGAMAGPGAGCPRDLPQTDPPLLPTEPQ